MDNSVIGIARSRLALLTGIGAALLLAAVTVWAYLPILDNGFVWDDGANLVSARVHWNRGLDGIAWAFSQPYFGHYQPLTWMSYQLDALISGATPRGVHATNLALHLIASLLVGALAWRLSAFLARRDSSGAEAPPGSLAPTAGLLAAAAFALHPIHVETVAWATERRDLLSTVLVLAAVLLHLVTSPADASPSRFRWSIALLHALAALARAQMSLPFVLLVLDIWPLRRLERSQGDRRPLLRLIGEKSLSFAVAAASATAAIWAQASSGALTTAGEHGFLDRVVQVGYNLAFYPAALAYRASWLPLHERPYPFEPLAPRYLVPAILALAALLLLAALVKRRRGLALAAAVACYDLFVLPVSGIAQSGMQLVAERYAYLATVPLLVLAAGAAARLLHRSRERSPLLALLGLLVILGLLATAAFSTHRQTRVWTDDETLWRHVLAHSGSCLADNNLGQILLARGESGPALLHLVRALERAPTYSRPWRAIAIILEGPKPFGAPPALWVATTLDRAAAFAPGSLPATYASALAWREAGESERALQKLRRILANEPDHDGARLALASLEARARGALNAPAPPTPP
jgi:protein O-mannosyl-transferase